MKIRTGFISNSSSSSFVVLLPEDWNPTDEDLLKDIGDYTNEESEEKQALEDLRKAIETLRSGGSIVEQDLNMEFGILNDVIPRDYVVASFDVSSDCGEIQGLDMAKVNKIMPPPIPRAPGG